MIASTIKTTKETMEKESPRVTRRNSIADEAGEACGNADRLSLPSSARSTRSMRSAVATDEEKKLSRSPGLKILQMAGQAPVYQCKFSLQDFRLRNPAVPDDGSDEYDTDLDSEELPTARRAFIQDTTGKEIYLEACKYYDVIPASFFIRNITASVVSLAHHGLGVKGVKALVVALLQNTKITELDLQDNDMCDEGGKDVATMFADNFYITKLNLSCNNIGLLTAKAFDVSLEGNGTLKVLNLSQNALTNNCIAFLCRGLAYNYSIAELNLSRNKLSEEGGRLVGSMLAEQHSLASLDLSWNGLGPRGIAAIFKGLQENTVLKDLNISWNAIGSDGVKTACKAFGSISLTRLDLSHNRLLVEGARSLAAGLRKNTSLEVLNVGHNILESSGVCFLLKAILANNESKICVLDISGTDLNQDFHDAENNVRKTGRNVKFIHENRIKEKVPKDLTDPRKLLKKFLDDNGIHRLDLFDFIDADASMSISVEEFKKGLKAAKCGLADFQIDKLMELLDRDNDGEIDYSEFSEF